MMLNLIISMGIAYTTQYIDFDKEEWKQLVTNPPEFEALKDGVALEIPDTNQKLYKLKFKKGAKVKSFRVVGKFRMTWDDEYLIEKV